MVVARLRLLWFPGPPPGNVGDVVTPWILKQEGVPFSPARRQDVGKVLGVGSIVRLAGPQDVVWGSGLMRAADAPSRKACYRCVRGPRTRRRVLALGGRAPDVMGDPAALLPHYYAGPVVGRRRDALVPHYVDRAAAQPYRDRLDLISPLTADPTTVVDQLVGREVVFSSSLHGLVLAHAYGIPAAWVRLSDALNGDDIKFADYMESVGLTAVPFRQPDAAARQWALASWERYRALDQRAIWEVRPWHSTHCW